ncbi:hypothetical protein N3K66_001891 [Trichothecium roseum]|uniref:Uncharacterized protein n=1 Tax=Trichothecium roseum TaxID=47278 RepID=A0ACC0V8B7_9HYPO|nr:hypothetical protein N3K66_001891 [Trichothecium roseum]
MDIIDILDNVGNVDMTECNTCQKAPPEVILRPCAKCSTTPYCSRDCQKADWKSHKKICARQAEFRASPTSLSPPKGLSSIQGSVKTPFARLDKGTWLHGRPEKDVYGLLIDAYRMRVEDMYKIEGEADNDSIYGGAADGLQGFRRFLERVEACPGLLPSWWDATKKSECEQFGMGSSRWFDLRAAVEKSDIVKHYGESKFPMQLRMFAEAVYGQGPGGADATAMRRIMMKKEQQGRV